MCGSDPSALRRSPAGLAFDFYASPTLHRAVPAGAAPGTSIVLVGTNLGGEQGTGIERSCRFGSAVVPATLHAAPRVVDNAWQTNTVTCVVPAAATPATGSAVLLSVSLNGQQYTPEPVRFAIGPGLAPPPPSAPEADAIGDRGSGLDESGSGVVEMSGSGVQSGSGLESGSGSGDPEMAVGSGTGEAASGSGGE